MRRLRRTGPSSSHHAPSRARWRSYHEATSVASSRVSIPIWQSTSCPTFTQSPRTPHPPRSLTDAHLSLVASVPPSHTPLHLSRLHWFAPIWTILIATIPSRTSIPARVMQYHSHSVLPYPSTSNPIIYPLRCITVHSSAHSRTALFMSCSTHRSLLL